MDKTAVVMDIKDKYMYTVYTADIWFYITNAWCTVKGARVLYILS